jgi:hypothetical protein
MSARCFFPAPQIVVSTNQHGQVRGFQWRRCWRTVAATQRTWQIGTGWWRGEDEAVQRAYYELRAPGGLLCIVYHDRLADTWHLEQIID